ncbi:MAG TPA: hypothetical protein VHN79_05665 [Lacunisphaera sp.]|nr:hypothetical protein [Lacunisphaera sp.]
MTEKLTLTPADRDLIASYLDECLGVFDYQKGLLSAGELQIKTMLTTARHQLDQYQREIQTQTGSGS